MRSAPSHAGSWVARGLSSPWAPVLPGIAILALGAWLALWLSPEPHSDWGHYWAMAGSVQGYERGGIGLWLLAIPKSLGLSPIPSALLLNLASAMAMLWVAWRADGGRVRWLWLLVAGYLLLISPFSGIVQLDLIAATQIAIGSWLVVAAPVRWPRPLVLPLAVLLVVMGVSTKPQYALTLWTLLILMAVPWWIWRRGADGRVRTLLWVLLAGSILGFALDSGMRSLGDRSEAIRTSSAVTLYGGLLVSHDRQGCGYWSVEAAKAARADLEKPMHRAAWERLSEKPVSHWVSVMRCKLPQILRPPPYALYWLVESPNVRASIDAHPDRERIEARYHRILRWERKLYAFLTLSILVVSVATSVVVWRRGERLAALLPVGWFASFWAVHLVFEIQGRYFLGTYLVAPLLCMLVLCMSRDGRSGLQSVERPVGSVDGAPRWA